MQKPFDIKGIRFGEGRPVICVPVVARERTEVVGKIRELAGSGVQMIEWRADFFDACDQPDEVRAVLEEIRPDVQGTVMLFTLRTKNQGGNADLKKNQSGQADPGKNQGGHADPGEKKILYLDEIAAKSGSIDMVDLEYFEADRPDREIRRLRQMGVRVIASHHDFCRTPDDVIMHKVMDRLIQSGADIAKLAVMPDSADDLIRLLKLTNDTRLKYPGVPIVTIAMGALGVVSRVTGEAFGSCITFGASGEGSAPGQMQADRLADVLDAMHEGLSAGNGTDALQEDLSAGNVTDALQEDLSAGKVNDALHEGLSAGNGTSRGHIYLIGFMGTGKTTVSGELKELLGLAEIDLDEEIVRESGMPVTEMFERFGEEYFRERETAMLRRVAEGEPAIVSCGGGCVLREENVSLMEDSGTTVLLTAEPETIYERVRTGTGRPLLNGRMDVDSIAELMEQRRDAYEAAGDIIVSTDGKTPGEIASEIGACLQTDVSAHL